VSQSLAGKEAAITERNIALQVYGRGQDFDAKIDGTIRVEAIRLRHKLREYYETSPSEWRIEIPKGTYAPLFVGFDAAARPPQIGFVQSGRSRVRAALLLVAAALVVTCAGSYLSA
jgi:hypothetical protein